MVVCFFLFDTHFYKICFPPKIKLIFVSEDFFFGLILAKSFFFQLKKGHSALCNVYSSDRDPRKLTVGSLEVVWRKFGKPSHTQPATRCIPSVRFVVLFSSILSFYSKGWKIMDD